MEAIRSFKGENYFLSNFYPCDIEYEGRHYASVECAYQAAKTLDDNVRYRFTMSSSVEAKRLGRRVQLRDNWDTIKYNIMYELLKLKFKNKELKSKLLATGDAYLEEGNYWNDRYWGVCRGEGQNNLGKLLMVVRAELSADSWKIQ